MLVKESKQDISSEESDTSISENENDGSKQQKLECEERRHEEEEKIRKTSVKNLADRFSNDSLDENSNKVDNHMY